MSEFCGENRFKGVSEHLIDDKGRIFIPSKMRDILGSQFTLSKSFDQCIEIHSEIGWQYKIADMAQNRRTDIITLKRVMGSSAEDVMIDKQGRIVIPPKFREYAGLKKEIVIIGAITHAEIWDKEKWEEFANSPQTVSDAKSEMDDISSEGKAF